MARATCRYEGPKKAFAEHFQLAVEVVGQFGAGYLTLTEMMRLTMPASDGYVAPIGDGTAIYFFMDSQPHLRAKMTDLRNRATAQVRRLMGVDEQQQQLQNLNGATDTPITDKTVK